MKTMIPLRGVAIASNVVFMTFGFAGRVYPVLVLHAVLLPLNLLRLRRILRKSGDIEEVRVVRLAPSR